MLLARHRWNIDVVMRAGGGAESRVIGSALTRVGLEGNRGREPGSFGTN
jgi:hypothetical protein